MGEGVLAKPMWSSRPLSYIASLSSRRIMVAQQCKLCAWCTNESYQQHRSFRLTTSATGYMRLDDHQGLPLRQHHVQLLVGHHRFHGHAAAVGDAGALQEDAAARWSTCNCGSAMYHCGKRERVF